MGRPGLTISMKTGEGYHILSATFFSLEFEITIFEMSIRKNKDYKNEDYKNEDYKNEKPIIWMQST